MNEFNTSLLREKFVISDVATRAGKGNTSFTALSNRMVVELKTKGPGSKREAFIIRSQNMHGCIRMAGRLYRTFHGYGPLLDRVTPFDWKAAWEAIVNDYEYSYNPQRWIAVYHRGRILFEQGKRHPILDIIEKYEVLTNNDYEKSLKMAEDGFREVGKAIVIDYSSNVALVSNFEGNQGRCAIILRGPDRTTTFNYSANFGMKPVDVAHCLAVAAAYLEGIQLAFLLGMNTQKIRFGIIRRRSQEEKQTQDARKRLNRLIAEINDLEKACDIFYRPEKPDLYRLVAEAETLGRKVLAPPKDSEDAFL